MRYLKTTTRFPLIVLMLVVVLLGGCATDRQVIAQANQFHNSLEPAVIDDPRLAEYLQAIGDRIIAAAAKVRSEDRRGEDSAWMFSKDMRFHFVNSKTINAFTTGGEHMYIYTALFHHAQTEDELAAVVAHEYAHVYGRHVHKGMNRQYAILGLAGAAGAVGYAAADDNRMETAGIAAGVALAAGQFIGMSYTRSDEAEADKLGFEFYTRAGWDPHRFGDFFQRMIDMGYDKGPEFLSDHPSLSSRVADAKRRAAALPPAAAKWRRPNIATESQFKALQQRSIALGAKMPDDKSLAQAQVLLAAMPRSCLTPAIHEDQKKAAQQVAAAARQGQRRQR